MTQAHNNANLDDELLSAYIDGELTDAERAAVEARLENDPAARELVTELRSLSGTLKSLPREALAEDLRSAVLGQIGTSQVSLPRTELSMARRLMWPAIAIAAALMLMFVQGDERSEVDKVASANGRAAERHERALADEATPAFEAPEAGEPASAGGESVMIAEADAPPASPAPVSGDRVMVAEGAMPPADAVAGTVFGEAVDDAAVAARAVTDAMAESDAELEGVVHLTLTDFHSGAERFNRLLVSNGVQLVGEPAAVGEPASVAVPAAAAPTTESFDSAGQDAATLSTRSAAPTGGFGGAMGSSSTSEVESSEAEPEMILVEAPPEQIEQILFGCAQDTEAIEEVAVDPTASGTNTVPAQQRLSNYQQYSRSSGKLALGSEYQVTPEQQSAIAVFNSVPKQTQAEPSAQNAENQQQSGWAARFYANEQPVQVDKLNSQYNRYRDQYFENQSRQQSAVAKGATADGAKQITRRKVVSTEPLRVLFLLHPSQEAAKK